MGRATQRKQRELLTALGVEVISFRSKRHNVYHCQAPGGARFVVTMSQSTSDQRAERNIEATVRRAIEQAKKKC